MHEVALGRSDDQAKGPAAPGRGLFVARTLLAMTLGAWTLMALLGTVDTTLANARADKSDFAMILDSSLQWRQGLPLYESRRTVIEQGVTRPGRANLNYPFTIPLLAPLTALEPAHAFLVWNGLGLAAFLVAVALALRATRLRLTPTSLALTTAALITCPGVIYGLQLGQWGLPLAAPVVGVWLLLRDPAHPDERRRTILAGLLLGILVLLKPFLLPLVALFLPRRRWPGLLAAGASGAGASLLALPLVGLSAYPDWLGALRSINWYDHGLNISLNGFLHRVAQQSLPDPVGWALQGLAVVLGAIVIMRRADDQTPASLDRAVGLLLILSLLGSPLGWLYYTPLLIPAILPALASWPALEAPRRWFLATASLLLWTPHILVPLWRETLPGDLTVRAAPTYGLLVLLAFLLTTRTSGDHDARGRHRPAMRSVPEITATAGD